VGGLEADVGQRQLVERRGRGFLDGLGRGADVGLQAGALLGDLLGEAAVADGTVLAGVTSSGLASPEKPVR
jgi:hypothetical protein